MKPAITRFRRVPIGSINAHNKLLAILCSIESAGPEILSNNPLLNRLKISPSPSTNDTGPSKILCQPHLLADLEFPAKIL